MDVSEFISDGVGFLLDLFPFDEDIVEFAFEFFVLGFDVGVGVFDVFRAGVDSDFVESDVVVGEGSFQISNFLHQLVPPRFQFVVQLLFLINCFSLLCQVCCLLLDILNYSLSVTINFSFVLFM